MRSSLFGISLLGLLILGIQQARADWYSWHAGLQCSGNEAAIRFGADDNGSPIEWNALPSDRMKWAHVPIVPDGKCALENGDTLAIRSGEEQAYAYGMGGADAPAFFSLWLNGKKVISRETFKTGYGGEPLYYNSLFYTDKKIARCSYPTSEENPTDESIDFQNAKSVKCESSNIDLSKFEKDPLELSDEWRSTIGTLSIAARNNIAFCRKFVFPLEKYKDTDATSYIWLGPASTTTKEVFAYQSLHPDIPFANDRGSLPYLSSADGHIEAATFDFNNDGKVDTVIKLSSDTHYFDGDIFLVKDGALQPDAVKDLANAGSYEEWSKKNGWEIVSSPEDRYMHRSLFRMDGKTFFIEYPTNRDRRPSATLFMPTERGLETACTFQIVEENY